MTTYITNIGSDKLKDLLIKLKKEDSLIIFHAADEKHIPIDMISMFANAKGSVEFKETGDEIEMAYEIGRLSANPRAITEIIGDLPVFDKLNEIIGVKKKPASRSSKASSVPSQTDKTAKASSVKKSSSSKNTAPKKDLVAFDNAYDGFTTLMESLITDKYDPTGCSLGVLSAIRIMNEDPSVTFENALPKTTSEASAKQFIKQISKTNLTKIIEAAREVVKYDS